MAPAGSQKRVKPDRPSEGELKNVSQPDVTANDSMGRKVSDRDGENTSSWYSKSWPRKPKAAAITEVARESISAANTIVPERLPTVINPSIVSRPARSPSIGLTKIGGTSTRSLPADVTTTRINIASVGSSSMPDIPSGYSTDLKSHDNDVNNAKGSSANLTPTLPADAKYELDTKEMDAHSDIPEIKPMNDAENTSGTVGEPANQSSGWLDWLSWSKNEPNAPQLSGNEPVETINEAGTEDTSQGQPTGTEQTSSDLDRPSSPRPSSSSAKKRSWLQMWRGSLVTSQQEDVSQGGLSVHNEQAPTEISQSSENGTGNLPLQTASPEPERDGNIEATGAERQAPKSSGWLFWSSKDPSSGSTGQRLTQADPETVSSPPLNKDPAAMGTLDPKKTNYELKSQPSQPSSEETSDESKGQIVGPTSFPGLAPGKTSSTSSPSKKTPTLFNQLLPAVRDTFSLPDRPGIIEQLGRLLHYSKEPQPRHVSLVPDHPRVKKALAIGIHGYFPAPFLRTVIGQPTGTSVKFSTLAAKAIHDWAETRGAPCEIENIALEGEGRIEERVDILWKLLLNRIEDIRTADFIMVSCHSQGVPVATMLVAKLISFGCVNSARVGICAMAGVNLGPFPDYRSRWISGSAGELFDFSNPNSKVSQDYMAALNTVLNFGVRVVYVGSIDDQLVSLESSVFSPISHPYIYRAVFVDGRVHAPSFLSHLVGFVMKLRNLGLSDHGLLRELSSPLAGSLYGGEGHSRLYDDPTVYRLAVDFTLETSSVNNATLEVLKYHRSPNSNPYILPFAMRGVLEEEYVRSELSQETEELLNQFDEWKPSSKALKDVKFRLEGIRSKL